MSKYKLIDKKDLENMQWILKKEKLKDWKIKIYNSHDGFCNCKKKTISLGIKYPNIYLLFLHEVAHALATPKEIKVIKQLKRKNLGNRHNNIWVGEYEFLILEYLLPKYYAADNWRE